MRNLGFEAQFDMLMEENVRKREGTRMRKAENFSSIIHLYINLISNGNFVNIENGNFVIILKFLIIII